MFDKVNELLEKYIGGQIFFTELDKAVKYDKKMLGKLIKMVDMENDEDTVTIASGEIGLAMHNFLLPIDILVPGGLRFDSSRIDLSPYAYLIKDAPVALVDDSYFSGKTAAVVKEAVEKVGGIWAGAWVAYDGSKHKEPDIHSLYRYYDYHDILGRPLK